MQRIFGRKPVIEAIKSGKEIEKLMILQTMTGEYEVELRKLSKEYNFQLQRVPAIKLDKLAKGDNHQGVIAEMAQISYQKLATLLPKLLEEKENVRLILIDGVEDVRNFGAIARSALAFDFDAIITFAGGTASINDIAIKVSAGALLNIPVCKEDKLSVSLELLGAHGVKIYASSLDGDCFLQDLDFTGSYAFVMGSEQKGVSRLTQDYADQKFKIHQSNKMESLNVSVAAGVIFHEAFVKSK